MQISAFLAVVVLKLLAIKHTSCETTNRQSGDIYREIEALKSSVRELTQQVMMQQMFMEERSEPTPILMGVGSLLKQEDDDRQTPFDGKDDVNIQTRTDGGSGVKVVRGNGWNLKNYDSATYLNGKAFSIHDHSDYDRTVGLGEMAVVINGVDFRTRHNDYKLVMSSRTSKAYHALDNIPFPGVPPEVLKQPTVEEQTAEMKKWFLAFKHQDRTERDYTKYFKPVLCYLEGAWTLSEELEEPFPSDRHQLDAKTWHELHQKNHFMSQTGARSRLENIAFLPRAIMSINETTGLPTYAQWNYRILCSPVDFDIPLSHYHQENDLGFRMSTGMSINEVRETRAARFKLFDGKRAQNHRTLDKIFATIPGKDNHGANLTLDVYGDVAYDPVQDTDLVLNTGYYHRSYRLHKTGASGLSYSPFGFNDENMWMAQTTQENVAPVASEQCSIDQTRPSRPKKRCISSNVRLSHAIPLEVIYLTPLLSWNPYNITYNADSKITRQNGRDGLSETTAYNGVDKTRYYKTPVEFFSGKLKNKDPADTVKLYMFVLGADGQAKKVAASGTRIMLPNIEGVGKIRTRYPIAPLHGEGSSVWKELNALKDRVLDTANGHPSAVLFQMGETDRNPPGKHSHDVSITYDEFLLLHQRMTVNVTSDESQGHAHNLVLAYKPSRNYTYTICDGASRCWDGHPRTLKLMTNNAYTEEPRRPSSLRTSVMGHPGNTDDFCNRDLASVKDNL